MTDIADAGSGVGGLDAAGLTGDDEYSTGRTEKSLIRECVSNGLLVDASGWLQMVSLSRSENQVSGKPLESMASMNDRETREFSISGLREVSTPLVHPQLLYRAHMNIVAPEDSVSMLPEVGTWSARYRFPEQTVSANAVML